MTKNVSKQLSWPFKDNNTQKKAGIVLMAVGFLSMAYTGGEATIFGLSFNITIIGLILAFLGLLYFSTAD